MIFGLEHGEEFDSLLLVKNLIQKDKAFFVLGLRRIQDHLRMNGLWDFYSALCASIQALQR